MQDLLSGLRVLDFTTNVAGPVATAMLADYGASVIKVERPVRGDDNRSFPPMMDGQGFIHFLVQPGKTVHYHRSWRSGREAYRGAAGPGVRYRGGELPPGHHEKVRHGL